MANKKAIEKRRETVNMMLAKGITSIVEISDKLKIPYDTAQNDIRWLREQTKPWLTELAQNGYAFDCKTGIDKLYSLQRRFEEIADRAKNQEDKEIIEIQALREVRETIISRLQIEGEGPTLMALRKVVRGEFQAEKQEKKI